MFFIKKIYCLGNIGFKFDEFIGIYKNVTMKMGKYLHFNQFSCNSLTIVNIMLEFSTSEYIYDKMDIIFELLMQKNANFDYLLNT